MKCDQVVDFTGTKTSVLRLSHLLAYLIGNSWTHPTDGSYAAWGVMTWVFYMHVHKSLTPCSLTNVLPMNIKGALCSFGEETVIVSHDWVNKLNMRKENMISYCLTLFTCGGPCHLSNLRQSSWDLIFPQEQLVYSATETSSVITSLIL